MIFSGGLAGSGGRRAQPVSDSRTLLPRDPEAASAGDAPIGTAAGRTDDAPGPEQAAATLRRLRDMMSRTVVGQSEMIDGLLIALLAGGHVLLEGLPGVAKTTAVITLARATGLAFARLQFTPDMLPADVVGSEVYRADRERFEVHRGPVFANLVLADEINRAPAKVQSALLEAMQERQVTIAGQSAPLPDPFLVAATQNPIEQEGTYPLPQAQLDRFLLKLVVPYPGPADERIVLDRTLDRSLDRKPGATAPPATEGSTAPAPVDAASIQRLQSVCRRVTVAGPIRDYIVAIVAATRDPERLGRELGLAIARGASPRATLGLATAAQAHATLDGRTEVRPDDVQAVAVPVLRHRVVRSYDAQADRLPIEAILRDLLAAVPLP